MSSKDDGSSNNSQKPTYSKFTQQELPACKPILTPGLVMGTFMLIAITFIPIGVSHLSASDQVVEIVHRYDRDCVPTTNANKKAAYKERVDFIQDSRTNKNCIRTLTVPKKMKPPIYVYYQLDNFYQNHRRYVNSRNDDQLRGTNGDQAGCKPVGTNDNPVIPCGLIAWSLFNDTYTLSMNNTPIPVNKKGIAWESDRSHKFGSDVFPKNFQSDPLIGGGRLNESLPLHEQEDLLVWMRLAALPTFRKLYGRIDTELQTGQTITVAIQNNYNTYSFEGKKLLVLSTTTWIGGKNIYLGRLYISVGGLCILVALAFMALYLVKPRPLGDPNYLSWNKDPQSL